MQPSYLDFDVAIEPATAGKYSARVLKAPAGEADVTFDWPFTKQDLEIFLLRIGHTRRGTRRIGSPEMEHARHFGRTLYSTVFAGPVGLCLIRSLDDAVRQGAGLRVRLRLTGVPELNDVPWEYLYSDDLARFLIVSTETPIVRYVDLPRPVRPLTVMPPLRVLAVVSGPSDLPPLDVETEWRRLQDSLSGLERSGLVQLERLSQPTLAALQRRLRRDEMHIFHFVGHGGFQAASGDGILYFEDDLGHSREVTGEDLGTVLHDHRSVRLAILNSCEGARSSPEDALSGAAQGLIAQGIPAVIAMQFEITDEAAIAFARDFYGAVADGYPVDASVAEARKAIFTEGNDVEWGTPVLYMRAADGHVFNIEKDAIPAPPVESTADLRAKVDTAIADGSWDEAARCLDVLIERDAWYPARGDLEEAIERGRQGTRLYRQARALFEDRQWRAVVERLGEIERLDLPVEDSDRLLEKAQEQLARAARREELDRQYQSAESLVAAERWDAASAALDGIEARSPSYPGVATLRSKIGRGLEDAQGRAARARAERLYVEALRAGVGADWPTVESKLDEIRRVAPEFGDPEGLRAKAAAARAARVTAQSAPPAPVPSTSSRPPVAPPPVPAGRSLRPERSGVRRWLPGLLIAASSLLPWPLDEWDYVSNAFDLGDDGGFNMGLLLLGVAAVLTILLYTVPRLGKVLAVPALLYFGWGLVFAAAAEDLPIVPAVVGPFVAIVGVLAAMLVGPATDARKRR